MDKLPQCWGSLSLSIVIIQKRGIFMVNQRVGLPLHTFKMATAAYAQTEQGNRIYTVGLGKPCVFYVIDADQGIEISQFPLIGSNHSWGICMTKDGSVYMGGDGYLYHYNANTDEFRNCGIAIEGETYFWRLAADDSGNVYGGTYPGGKVFQYNPATDTFRDYGSLMSGQYYARSMDTAPDNKLYVGLGTQKAEIVELDTITGATRLLPIPEGQEKCIITYDLDVHDEYLFARYTDTLDLLVYHLDEQKWVHKIDGAGGYDVSSPDENRNVYFLRNKQLHSLNLDNFELKALPLMHDGAACDFGWLSFDDPELPGLSLVSTYAGGYFIYNPKTQKSKHVELAIKGIPTAIQSLTIGANDVLHIGGYFTGGYSSYDPSSNQFSESRKFGQPEQLYMFQNKLYLGIYPGANIFEYDPAQPWINEQNPKLVFSLGDKEQDRPFAMTSTEDKLVVGTVPNYGKLGGALAFYHPATGQLESFVNVVEKQSIIALCYHSGMIYGGTSVYGGLGGTAEADEGKLFIWDTIQHQKVYEFVPVKGEKVVSALTVGKNGLIWGMTTGHLFAFNPETKAVEQMHKLFEPLDWSKQSHYWRGVFLNYDLEKDIIYGNCLDKLFSFSVESAQMEVLQTGGSLFARDSKGTIYYTKEAELYKLVPEV